MIGYILTAFILGIPANEIVLPIILMCYLSSSSLIDLSDTFAIREILLQNGWTILTGINVMIFILLHFPCSTTLITIYKETKSIKWTILSFILPTLCGIVICMITNRNLEFNNIKISHILKTFDFYFANNFRRIALKITYALP